MELITDKLHEGNFASIDSAFIRNRLLKKPNKQNTEYTPYYSSVPRVNNEAGKK